MLSVDLCKNKDGVLLVPYISFKFQKYKEGLVKVAHEPQEATQPELNVVSPRSIKQLEALLLLLDGMLVHSRVAPNILSPVPIYTPADGERQCAVKFLF